MVALLLALVGLPYLQVWDDQFLAYDDPDYLNPTVREGLTASNLRWAFGFNKGLWAPLTWLSHMLDAEAFGMWPGGHKLHNLAIHLAAVALLWRFLAVATGDKAFAFIAALLWGVHPMRVESVAWVSERKDTLSLLFVALTLNIYLWHTRRPSAPRLLAVAAGMALSLAAKPTAVTLPAALLLLDVWPLRRTGTWHPRRLAALVAEKLLLLAMSVAASFVALLAQRQAGALAVDVPWTYRAPMIVNAYGRYLLQLTGVGPFAVSFPRPPTFGLWQTAASAGALLGVSLWVALRARVAPWLAVGWLWFLGTLAPMVGFIPISLHAHADRFTYLPHIGPIVALAWHLRHGLGTVLARGGGAWRTAHAGVAALAVLLGVQTALYTRAWHDSERLFLHTLATGIPNPPIESNLGSYYEIVGRHDEAAKRFARSVELQPRFVTGWLNLIRLLQVTGRQAQAAGVFEGLRARDPTIAKAVAEELLKAGRMQGFRFEPAERLLD
jgi:hypothetical protein